MLSVENTVIIAAAGSRKTTFLVEFAIDNPTKRIAILTYTIENYNQIKEYFFDKCGFVPANVKIQTWYSFLLADCVRPYQNFAYTERRIENICFVNGKSAMYVKKTDTRKYFFHNGKNIYTDKISEFSLQINEKSKGLIAKRLENIYDMILIDEVQDLAGYDFDLLELLLKSKISITLVGDNRQSTYFTNLSSRYKKLRGKNIVHLFKEWEKQKLCSIIEKNECYRCNQSICDFADKLYPFMTKTLSKNTKITGHDGIFIVEKSMVENYISIFKPQVLTYKKSSETQHLQTVNFGLSKGLSFDRVLIFPTKKIEEYLKNDNIATVGDIPKFYVAITRARYSVAIVFDGKPKSGQIIKYQQSTEQSLPENCS